jgi:hypothetical protein
MSTTRLEEGWVREYTEHMQRNPSHQGLLGVSLAVVLAACSSAGVPGASPPDAAAESDAAADGGPAADTGLPGNGGLPVLDQDSISVVTGSLHEHEPTVAVASNGRVLVSWLSFVTKQSTTVGYRISNDFGATWGPATLLPLPADANVQGNATAAADGQGRLYLAWAAEMSSAAGRSHQRVLVATAGPNDMQLGTPVEVTDPSVAVGVYDRPHIAVTSAGVLNVTYDQSATDYSSDIIVDAISKDGGTSWTRVTVAGPGSSGSFRNVPRVCRSAEGGRIFMSWLEQDVDGIALSHSDDDGATWSSPILASLPEETNLLVQAPTDCTTRGNDVSVLYALSPVAPTSALTPVLSQLRIAHSHDRGATIAARVSVEDTAAGAATINPVFVAEDDGALELAYYAGKAANDASGTFRRSRSTDGVTFPPSVLVHAPVTLETSRAVPQWIGDYVGSAYQSGSLYLVYTNNGRATPHVSFYRTSVTPRSM